MTVERRRFVRKTIGGNAEITAVHGTGDLPAGRATIVDCSRGGALLRVPAPKRRLLQRTTPLQPSDSITCVLRVPPAYQDMEVFAEVVRVLPVGEDYHVGVRFFYDVQRRSHVDKSMRGLICALGDAGLSSDSHEPLNLLPPERKTSARLEKKTSARLEKKTSARLKKKPSSLEKKTSARLEKKTSARLKKRPSSLERKTSARIEKKPSSLERKTSARIEKKPSSLERKTSARIEKKPSSLERKTSARLKKPSSVEQPRKNGANHRFTAFSDSGLLPSPPPRASRDSSRVHKVTFKHKSSSVEALPPSRPAAPAAPAPVYYGLAGPESGLYLRGTVDMRDGRAIIELPAHFAKAVDPASLTVHLTPCGECCGLYVAKKAPHRIAILELRQGKSDLPVDYLLMAQRR